MDEGSNLLPIQMIDGRQIQGYQLFPPQIPNAVLGGSAPDVPGKFDLVRLID